MSCAIDQQQSTSLRPDPLLLAQLQAGGNGSRYPSIWPNPRSSGQLGASYGDAKTALFLNTLEEPDASSQLPAFIRPLPGKISAEDVTYLHMKGALTLPSPSLQNALLRAYVEYVHPYMPLMELHDFLSAINSVDGLCGQISLFLYHAVMFAGTAYVDMKYLKEAGYTNRKAARKVYFQKTRVSLSEIMTLQLHTLTAVLALVRLRLRERPPRSSPITALDDILVRDSR